MVLDDRALAGSPAEGVSSLHDTSGLRRTPLPQPVRHQPEPCPAEATAHTPEPRLLKRREAPCIIARRDNERLHDVSRVEST
jgi:hypothetical protein